MKQAEKGWVMPFALSGTRLRRSAQDYRRRGQALEALSLTRRAACQDDNAPGWLALAAELRLTGNWEAAARIHSRAAALEEPSPAEWLNMARCMSAMGRSELMEDCLARVLSEAPWSPEGDAARDMLQGMPEDAPIPGAARLPRLMQRGVDAWQNRRSDLGLRRLRRAMRLTNSKARLMNMIALMYMMDGHLTKTARWFARAARQEPQSPVAVSSLALLCHHRGRRRMARALLRMAAPLCREPHLESRFLDTALTMGAQAEMEAYLTERLRHTPFRIPLLHARAALLRQQSREDEAREVYRLILSIDPDDREAAIALGVGPEEAGPDEESLRRLHRTALIPVPEALFRCGGEARRALDWCAASPDREEQRLALTAAAAHPDRAGETRWLLETLLRPDTAEALREKALVRLAALQYTRPVTAILTGRLMQVQTQPSRGSASRQLWQAFLPRFLMAARPYGHAAEAAAFAARIWRTLTLPERQDAALGASAPWRSVMLALWLSSRGMEAEAQAQLMALPLPQRRIRRLWLRLQNAPAQGETER